MAENENDKPDVVAKDTVVSFHFEMRDDDGEVIATSRDSEPVMILKGYGGVVSGLDDALEGRHLGEQFEVSVPPHEAYGMRFEESTRRMSKKHLAGAPKRLRPGMQVMLRTEKGLRTVTVVKVGSSMVDLDMNHPFAGKTLHFSVEITGLRSADNEELAHGHAHGPGGRAH